MLSVVICDFLTIVIAQEGVSGGVEKTVKQATEAAPPQSIFSNLWLPMLLVLGVYLFLMILPARRDQKKMKELMDGLKKNDRVLTNSGIKGTVVNLQKDSPWVTLRICESTNAKMQVLRSAISRVLGDEKEELEAEK